MTWLSIALSMGVLCSLSLLLLLLNTGDTEELGRVKEGRTRR